MDDWPNHAPDFPSVDKFDDDRVNGLLALTRYVCGIGERGNIFLDLRKSGTLGSKKKVRNWVHQQCPEGAALGRTDIDNFRRGKSRLDERRIKLIYYYLYEYFRPNISEHLSVLDLVYKVYFPASHSPAFLAATLYKYFGLGADTIRRFSKALRGVYFLYRYGHSKDDAIDVVRSVAAIALVEDQICTRLRFSLVYKGRQITDDFQVDGVVLPVHGRLFFATIDNGSPCLLITNEPDWESHPEHLIGLMLRKNTYERATASRIVLKRTTKPLQEETPKLIENAFQNQKSEAKILTLNAAKNEIAAFENFIDQTKNLFLTD
jgi:hypothetical protein